MKRKKTKKKQQTCDAANAIDAIEQGAATAMKVYRVVKPIIKSMVAHRRKTK